MGFKFKLCLTVYCCSWMSQNNNARRNFLTNTSYGFASGNVKDAEYKRCVNYSTVQEKSYLQRSISADDVVVNSRGFKPSDRHDPVKRNFLENLTSKILHFDMESGETTPINLQKLLTPASDSHELLQAKNKKMFASSYFYAPSHPTVEDQVELARRISHSLSDVRNMKSKGQSMYVNRKKRSVKWIHDGNGIEDEEEPSTPVHRDKMPLKCLMNPNGKVLDIHGIQALGEEVNIEPMPKNREKLFDIVRDLNNQRGRGAEIFAKRRKRSEKWVVDKDQPQTPSTPNLPKPLAYPGKLEMNGNSKFSDLPPLTPLAPPSTETKPFYNPFTVNLSLDSTNLSTTGSNQSRCNGTECSHHSTEVKKVYLREVAVGTDSDFPHEKSRSSVVEKSRRISFGTDNDRYNGYYNGNNCNGNAAVTATNINNRRVNNSHNKHTPSKSAFSNATNKEVKTHGKERYNKDYMQNNENDKLANQQGVNGPSIESEENEYTPVPVKQLIQEFEKTCRPVLQYKQISPKVIPIVQQSPIDNDIARFFNTRNSVQYRAEEKYNRIADHEQYEEPAKLQAHYNNGYVSTDDTEYTTDDTDSQMNDYDTEEIMYREKSETSSMVNGEREYSSLFQEEYSTTSRRRSATSEEIENLCKESGDDKFLNTDADVPMEAKSLLLSMIASQEDILETIKHLRNTPVLDNLLTGASPECNFSDIYPDLGKKLYENNEYMGPKLASVHNLTNYNTAPRGWNQSLTYYRPIKFEKPQEIVYSDF